MKPGIKATIDGKSVTMDKWKIKLADFDQLKVQLAIIDWKPVKLKPDADFIPGPVLLHGHFISDIKGTWIRLGSLRRGIIIVNGHDAVF